MIGCKFAILAVCHNNSFFGREQEHGLQAPVFATPRHIGSKFENSSAARLSEKPLPQQQNSQKSRHDVRPSRRKQAAYGAHLLSDLLFLDSVGQMLFKSGKNPHAHKNKIGTSTPPPKKNPEPPPLKEEFYGHGGFPVERAQKCLAPIKLVQPFRAPELRAEILWTPRFF